MQQEKCLEVREQRSLHELPAAPLCESDLEKAVTFVCTITSVDVSIPEPSVLTRGIFWVRFNVLVVDKRSLTACFPVQ